MPTNIVSRATLNASFQTYATSQFKMKLPIVLSFLLACGGFAFDDCRSFLVETIPQDLIYNETIISKNTTEQLLQLIDSANSSIDIASFYWTLLGKDVMQNPVPESRAGELILNGIVNAAKNRSVRVRIAVNDDKDR